MGNFSPSPLTRVKKEKRGSIGKVRAGRGDSQKGGMRHQSGTGKCKEQALPNHAKGGTMKTRKRGVYHNQNRSDFYASEKSRKRKKNRFVTSKLMNRAVAAVAD